MKRRMAGTSSYLDRLRPCSIGLAVVSVLLVSTPGFGESAKTVALGNQHSCVITATGGVKCWGQGQFGQLGNGVFRDEQEFPVVVTGLTNAVDVTAGGLHTCAVTSSGAVKCWGDCLFGQTGSGTCPAGSLAHNTPVDVLGLGSGVIAVAAGASHTCALTSTGAVKCWGLNGSGQLGDTTTINRPTPVDVAGLTGVVALSAGGNHTCALTVAGGVKCWGANGSGELGDGTTAASVTPVNVTGLASGVTSIAAGQAHNCAALATGGATCWGLNASGQLGDGTTTDSPTPVNVLPLASTVVNTLEGGATHSCAVLFQAGIVCWGGNTTGQIGIDSTAGPVLAPTSPLGLQYVMAKDIATGAGHTCAVLRRGEVKCWGSNALGQVGDGTFGNVRLTGVRVYQLGGWVATDEDGDGLADSVVWRGGTGTWYVRESSVAGAYKAIQWGSPATGDIATPADYDGDGRMDIAVWRPSNGSWYALMSSVDFSRTNFGFKQWGTAGDVPVPADYDGDGEADLAVWRPSEGRWYILRSTMGYSYGSYLSVQWGAPTDIPVQGDYDGDGKADLAVWRPSTGTWYVLKSSANYSYASYYTQQWGTAGDRLVPGDYDGDGRTDFAVWRPSNGIWYSRASNGASMLIRQWGDGPLEDVPTPADYDGDHMIDLVVWRPATGMWYIEYSGSGWGMSHWGLQAAGDVPVAVK